MLKNLPAIGAYPGCCAIAYPQEGCLLQLCRGTTLCQELAKRTKQQSIRRPGLEAGQVEQHRPAQPELAVQRVRRSLHHVLGNRRLHARVQHDNDNPCTCNAQTSLPGCSLLAPDKLKAEFPTGKPLDFLDCADISCISPTPSSILQQLADAGSCAQRRMHARMPRIIPVAHKLDKSRM